MPSLTTKRARNQLKPRREPYWTRLHKGAYLGFRAGPNTWVARYRDRDGKQHYNALAAADDYDTAKRMAESWFERMESPASRTIKRGTIREALESYLDLLREQGRDSTADNALERFELIVWDDPIADLRLEDMTREDFREWRARLRRNRKNRTVNRHVRGITAGLNVAIREGHSGNPEAWTITPLVDDKEDTGETIVFLTANQRQAIIDAASPACRAFLEAIEHTGARPGEIAAAVVADLDTDNATLTLRHKKGRPAKLRARPVVLTREANNFFKRHARNKLPGASLLMDPTGDAWNRHRWADEIQAAIATVNAKAKGKGRIPAGASAYSFRHARISELLQVYGIDPVTVAHQTGTSLRMIERAYFKFIAPALRDKLAAIEGRQ